MKNRSPANGLAGIAADLIRTEARLWDAAGVPVRVTEATLTTLTRDDIVRFHSTWFKPNNSTLIVVGDPTVEEIKPKLEKLFGEWGSADVTI